MRLIDLYRKGIGSFRGMVGEVLLTGAHIGGRIPAPGGSREGFENAMAQTFDSMIARTRARLVQVGVVVVVRVDACAP